MQMSTRRTAKKAIRPAEDPDQIAKRKITASSTSKMRGDVGKVRQKEFEETTSKAISILVKALAAAKAASKEANASTS